MRRAAAWPLAAALLLGGCVPASPDVGTYDDKASQTLGSAVSEVRTVQRVMETSYDGRMLRPTALTQMRYSEDALDTATGAFTELNPPPPRDRLFDRANTLLGDAGDLVTRARITLERSEERRYPGLARQLGRTANQLERLEERLQ